VVQHHGAAEEPQRRKLRHVLIVTGPSGAGKSTFLDHLASRALQPDILAQLPPGSERWTQIQELAHKHWMAQLEDPADDSGPAEVAMHYDMTHTELAFIDCFERDPALQLLRMAETVTIIHIRPAHRRLVQQWGIAKLGVRTIWRMRQRKVISDLAAVAQCAAMFLPARGRRLRWLRKAIRRVSERWHMPWRQVYALYLRKDGPATVYRSWDAFVRQTAGQWTQIRHIHLQPDPASQIGTWIRWRVVEAE
jgi:hypothetical protein